MKFIKTYPELNQFNINENIEVTNMRNHTYTLTHTRTLSIPKCVSVCHGKMK